jgi:endonuclease/exonuclease/phosphatase family metal-dependent hydrolase
MVWRIVFVLLTPIVALGQSSKIMTWNLLNFSASSTDRIGYYQTVIDSMLPDILAVQEVEGRAAANYFHSAVIHNTMAMATFISGPDSENALFYNDEVFSLSQMQVIPTTLRNIAWYTLKHLNTGDSVHVFSVHLKSSPGTANENQRLSEVNALRTVTDNLPDDSYFIVCGDFNFYGPDEPAYERLLDQSIGSGYFVDPIGTPYEWSNEDYSIHHTQSSRVRSFGGGASSGLDDRFDLILFSFNFGPNGSVQYLYNTSWAVGNDGMHYNDSINAMPNTSVSQNMANALHYASDHLPVVTSFNFVGQTGIQAGSKTDLVNVYPNPSNGSFNLSIPAVHLGSRFSVYAVDGRFIDGGNTLDTLTPINLEPFADGPYLLQLHTEKSIIELNLIKQ